MTTFRLDTAKLARDIDYARRAGAPDELSYREIGRRIDIHPSAFTRISSGRCPEADALMSIMMWLSPDARFSDYALAGDRRRTRPAAPRRHSRIS